MPRFGVLVLARFEWRDAEPDMESNIDRKASLIVDPPDSVKFRSSREYVGWLIVFPKKKS